MKQTRIAKKLLSAVCAGLMLFTMPVGAYAETPPPPDNPPIVIDGESSDSSNPGSSEDFVSSDLPTEEEFDSTEDTQEEPEASSDSFGDSAYTTSPDAATGELTGYQEGRVHRFPGTVVLVDENDRVLPMPRTYPAVIEGPMWNNPNGRSPYLYVTFNGVIAYCIEPAVFDTHSNVNYVQKKEFNKLKKPIRDSISWILKFGSPKGNDAAYNDWHAATQCLIWEVADGKRDTNMVLTGANTYYNELIKVFPGMGTKYNQMIQQVKSWSQIPSFANQTIDNAPTYKMEGDGPYTVTLTNTNAACNLSAFGFKATGIASNISDSQVTFTSATEITSEVLIEGGRTDVTDSSDNYVFWYDPNAKDQTRMSPGPDPVPCYFKLGTENSNPGGGDEPENPTGDYSITIRKFESGTNMPLDGAQFHIEYLGTNGDIVVPPPPAPEPDPDQPLGRSVLAADTGDGSTHVEIPEYETTVTIESGGKTTVKVPYRGIYKVTEVVPPENHLLDRNPVQTTVCTDAAPDQTIDFHNDAYTSIRVKKVDKTTGQPLANATIQIEKVDGSVKESRQTGNDGIALFSDLQPGAYRITELQAPDGYELTTEVITRDIQSNRVEEVVLNNQAKAGFRIRKVAAESGQGLQGAVFDLYHKDGAFINSYISDRNGLITVEKLPEGWYTVIERQPPEGYLLDPDHTSQDVHLTGAEQDVIFRDPKMPSLKIEKIDANNGRKLSGAVFTVRERDGAESFEITTGPDGTIQKDGLKATWYVITEIKAPNGYVVDSTPIVKQLEAGKTTQVIVQNGQKPSLTIRKVDKISGEGIPGVTLRIAKNGSLEYRDVLTENGGYVILKDMEPGHYTVTEIACPEEYILDSTPHEIEIVVGKNAVLTITNQAKPSLRIEKLDAETRQPLPGAVFNISLKNGKDLGNFTTDANGQIFLPNCETGLYVIREVSAPNGHLTDSTSVEALVEEGKIKTVTLSNMPEHPLLIKKVDAKTGLPLANATFLVSKVTGEHVGEYVSGRNGFITVTGLVPGFYTIKELKAPDGYLLNDSVQTVELKENEPAIVVFENQPKAALRLNKVDSKTHEPLAGAKFKLTEKGGNYIGEYTTDANGQISVEDLSPGWYTIVETYAPEGYLLDAAPKDIELKWGVTARLELTNTAFSGLQVKKTDAASGEPLEGIRFRLTTMSGDFVGDYMTGPGGYFVAQNLTPGWYTCRETATLPGYILDETPKNVQIKADSVSILEFTNVPMNSLQIRKVDAVTKEPLAGIRFRLTTMEGTYIGDYKTNSAGLIAVPSLTPGWYSAYETETIPGYILDTTPQNIKIEANKLATLEFVNQPESDLLVRKLDSITKKPLAGVKFRLTTMKNELVGDYTTGSGGYFTVNGLTPGWYLISETQTIPGYLLDSTVQRIEIVKGKPATAEFVNQPLNSLQVRKVDSVTGMPIPGVRFRLTRMDGQQVGDYTTDAAGMFAASDLEPGWYTAWELQTIPGYILDTTPQNVQLISGKAATLEFQNVPLSGLQIRKSDSVTGAPLGGAEFKVEQPDGRLIGSFVTDSSGIIYIPNLKEGVLVVTETKAPDGYKLDPAPRRIEVRSGQLNVLEYRNQPWPILAIRKVDAETGAPLAGVRIRLFDAYSRELGTYTTNSLGKITLTGMEAGNYSVQEVSTIEGYVLDTSIRDVSLSWGKTTTVEITNKLLSTLRVRKIDSETGKPLYGVTFLLYDLKNNVLGEYTTNQNGVIEFPRELAAGRYRLKEIKAANGYVLDDTLREITLKAGETTEIVIQNAPERGQIQIVKKSAKYNDITKKKAGALLEGAVFEIIDRSNTVVDRITTDRHGVATSKPLPMGVYGIREITAPKHYILNDKVFYAEIKVSKDLIQFEVLDDNEETSVDVQKFGNIEAMPGDVVKYDFKHIANTSTVELEDFYFHDKFPTDAVRLEKIETGTWSERLTYQILYKTNLRDYRILKDNLSTQTGYTLDCGRDALGLRAGEYITDIKFEFGTVQPGFQEKKAPVFYCTVNADLPNEYRYTNCADVGGQRYGEWVIAKDCWTTIVYAKPRGNLPKTGL